MWVQVKLIVMTVFLTGLIWMYADQAVKETEPFRLTAKLSADENLIPTIIEPSGGAFTVVVSGTAKDVARARKDAQTGLLRDFMISLGDLGAGRHQIDLQARILESRILADRKLALDSVSPSHLVVGVDEWVSKDVKLVPGTPVGSQFLDPPTFDPATVAVTYPASRRDDLPLDEGIRIEIAQYIQGKSAGEKLTFQVPMPVVLGDLEVPITCSPARVTLRLTLRTSLIEEPLGESIPIWWLVAPDLLGQYKPEFKLPSAFARPNLKGPREVLTALKPQQVRAYILFTQDDVQVSLRNPQSWLSKPVQYHFPSKEISLVGQSESIDFRIKPIKPSPENVDAK